jgi:hypothetical protein
VGPDAHPAGDCAGAAEFVRLWASLRALILHEASRCVLAHFSVPIETH